MEEEPLKIETFKCPKCKEEMQRQDGRVVKHFGKRAWECKKCGKKTLLNGKRPILTVKSKTWGMVI